MAKYKDTNHDSTTDLQISHDTMSEAVVLDERDDKVQNRDIGAIPATELDGITINRTKSGVDPFTPIRKERLVDQLSGAPSRSYGVWVRDSEANDGWRDVGTVSENYLLLTNDEVRKLNLEIAKESGLAFKESRIYWDGSRFGHVIDFVDKTETIRDDDTIGLSLITRTSYDRSWKFESALMGKRFFCDNGILWGGYFARVGFKHVQTDTDETWQDIVRQGLSIISHADENLARFTKGLRMLQRESMTDEHLRNLWLQTPKLGDSVLGKVMSRYVRHEEPTLYGFLNAGTNIFWHNEKMTSADFTNNNTFSSSLLNYAFKQLQ